MWGTLCIEYQDTTYRYRCNDSDTIYDRMMEITENDHEASEEVASWAEVVANIGDEYESDLPGVSIWVED